MPQKANRRPGASARGVSNGPVRVKGCGKSAPRLRRRRRHGKPHREQDRVGAVGPAMGQAGFRAAARVGRARRPATGVPDEWSSPRDPAAPASGGQNPAYRPSDPLISRQKTGSGRRLARWRRLGPFRISFIWPIPNCHRKNVERTNYCRNFDSKSIYSMLVSRARVEHHYMNRCQYLLLTSC